MEEKIWMDRKKGEVFFDNTSLFIWRRNASAIIQREYEGIIGPATRSIFREATRKVMREVFFKMAARYHKAGPVNASRLAINMLKELPKYGYGVPEMVFIDDKSGAAKVRVRNCFNALGYKNTSRPVCYRMEGILASLFENVFGRKVACKETRCSATGHQCCEFEVSSYNIPVKLKGEYPYTPKNLVPISVRFNPDRGEVFHRGVRAAFFPRGDAKRLEEESERIIGSATRGIYYMIGRIGGLQSVGRRIPSTLLMKILARFFKRKFLSRLAEIVSEFGYGVLEYTEIDMKGKRVVARLYNSANAAGVRKSERPVCYTLTGLFSGSADVVFGRTMRCVEVKCVAMGDPYCEFHVYPEED
jgi:predicted hydrocarbon binding protein